MPVGRDADDALDRHDALVAEVSGGHLDLPHELPGDRVDRRYVKGAQRIGQLSRLAKRRHAIVDIYTFIKNIFL